tara:strand:+ start:4341 stop:4640 length:300 start_codon:yes stop_codon:yes gene_type:complete
MLQSTLIALALYKSMGLFISFISEDVTIITWIEARMFNRALQINTRQKRKQFSLTSSAEGQISFIIRYTMRRRLLSLDWKSFVTAKKTSVASVCDGCEQ